MPTVSQKQFENKPVSRHASLSGKSHYFQRNSISRNNSTSNSYQDLYGNSNSNSKYYKKPSKYNNSNDDFEERIEYNRSNTTINTKNHNNYRNSNNNYRNNFRAGNSSFSYNYHNHGNHHHYQQPILTQSQINEKIRHEIEMGRKTNIQLNLLMNKTALWVNRQRFELFAEHDLNDSYT